MLSWSGGKDSSLALNKILGESDIKVVGLVTTVTQDYDRISMHGVRRSLLRQQAASIGLPLYEVGIPKDATNEIYEKEMQSLVAKLMEEKSVSAVVFGDIFLQDIREYREKLLSRLEMKCIFPLWAKDTRELARSFIEEKFRAIICTVDPRKISPDLCGREFDYSFLSALPSGADPCGENGEFHTFVFDGPIFKKPINVVKGQIVERDGFYFADILPLEDSERGGESTFLRQ